MQNRTTGWIIGIVVIVVIVVLAVMGQQGKLGGSDGYQAVFLTNGQVYFGKVTGETSDPVIVKDIFYLRVTQQKVQAGEEGQEQQAQSQVQLIKLGNELHGPKDLMRINRDHILFVEDLNDEKNDDGKFKSRVLQAITDFKDRGTTSPSPAAS